MFHSFIQNSPDGIVIINSLGMVTEWSPGEEQITGIPRAEALGQPLWEIQYRIAPEDQRTPSFLQAAKEKILNGVRKGAYHKRTIEEQIQRPDGTRRDIQSDIFNMEDGRDILACRIIRDITERKQLERMLEEAKDQLVVYAREIIRAQETERKRVAAELHDDTSQNLSLLALEIDKIMDSREKLSENILMSLKTLRDDVDRTQKEVRRFIHELRPGVLDYLGLEAALEGLVKDIDDKGEIAADLILSGNGRRLSDEVELSLFRIAQEALNNCQKHSNATKASVSLQFYAHKVKLAITDNGKGFDVQNDVQDAVKRRRLGLIGMQERADLIGGSLKIKSVTGKGSTVSIEVPQ
jgi:two-component system, NarL family, sensor histidine kinase DegS